MVRLFKNKFFVAFLTVLAGGIVLYLLSRAPIYKPDQIDFGVTFSKQEALDLGLDWKKVFLSIFEDLGVKKIRLSAYWNEIEPKEGVWNWTDTDWQIKTAGDYNASIILAVGGRLPRWPECHFPAWAEDASAEARDAQLLNYIKETVNRYKNEKQIYAWQVENEPFLPHFGECPPLDTSFLDKEIALVRSLDSRPIVITDSGELSLWFSAAERADIFGTSLYRNTYSKTLGMYVHYPIAPWFFRLKKNVVNLFAHPKKWIVIELQAEPWAPVPFQDITEQERDRTMDDQKFHQILSYARQTGFREFYLWGVEWWYWEKQTQNNPKLWNDAKLLFHRELAY